MTLNARQYEEECNMVACSYCGAAAGEPCITKFGIPVRQNGNMPHQPRRDARFLQRLEEITSGHSE